MSIYNKNKRLTRVSLGIDDNPRVMTVNRYIGGRFIPSYYPIGKLKREQSASTPIPTVDTTANSIVMTKPNKEVTSTDAPIEFKKAPTWQDKKDIEDARKKKLAHKKLIASKIAKVLKGKGIQHL